MVRTSPSLQTRQGAGVVDALSPHSCCNPMRRLRWSHSRTGVWEEEQEEEEDKDKEEDEEEGFAVL